MQKLIKSDVAMAMDGNIEVIEKIFSSKITGISVISVYNLAKQLEIAAKALNRVRDHIISNMDH